MEPPQILQNHGPQQSPGVVAKWNAAHPDEALRVGDRIVKIGGDESLQGFALIEKLKEDAGKFLLV